MKNLVFLLIFPLIACENNKSRNEEESQQLCSETLALQQPSEGDFQFIYPDHRPEYAPGTIVYQPKTGQLYRCKSYPYSRYCQQWSATDRKFEPGTGSNWFAAWDPL